MSGPVRYPDATLAKTLAIALLAAMESLSEGVVRRYSLLSGLPAAKPKTTKPQKNGKESPADVS